jgi:uncharacterized membrane protein
MMMMMIMMITIFKIMMMIMMIIIYHEDHDDDDDGDNNNNDDVKIKITVIETYKPKVIYTNEEKYKHFKELNPNIELFRQTFELDL